MQRSHSSFGLLISLALNSSVGLGAPQPADSDPAPTLQASAKADAEQADGIAQLEAVSSPDSPRKARLKRQLKEVRAELRVAQEALMAAEQRLSSTELRVAEQAKRIEELTGELANAELRVTEAELRARLAGRGEPESEAPTENLVKVRAPIVSAPKPPKVVARTPAAMATETSAPVEEHAEATPPAAAAAVNSVRAWATAWSDQRADDYLSFYAAGFQPPNGIDRAAWEAQRRQRLRVPGYIRVAISSLDAVLLDDGTVRASFLQEYESDSFADSVAKVLTLAATDGTWRIIKEQSTPSQ